MTEEKYWEFVESYRKVVIFMDEPADNNPTAEWLYQMEEGVKSTKWMIDHVAERIRNILGRPLMYYTVADKHPEMMGEFPLLKDLSIDHDDVRAVIELSHIMVDLLQHAEVK